MIMDQKHWIDVRDKLGFLSALMHKLASDNSQLILEGNLSRFDFRGLEECEIAGEYLCSADTSVICLSLTENQIKPVLRSVQPDGKFVSEILSIQIRVCNEIQFLAGDNFHNECISVGPAVPIEFLEMLKKKGIIRNFQTDEEAKAKYPWLSA